MSYILCFCSQAESVEALEHRMLAQENVIASMELRAAFSLHCVHLETQLVHAHLEILATVLNTLVAVQMRGHSDVILFFFSNCIIGMCMAVCM